MMNIANGFNRWKQNLIIDMSLKVETLGYMKKTKKIKRKDLHKKTCQY